MAEVIRMPLLSDTMTEGVILEWHKKVGDKVKADEAIADVETDKATMEVMPYVEGTLLYIGVEAGKAAPVNGIIAIIGKPGEDFQALLDAEKGSTAKEEKSEAQPAAPATTTNAPAPSSKDASVIRMPLLSDTMAEGKIENWLKKVGDKVAADDAIAEVETDKATMEVYPYVDGTLLYIGVQEGESAKVNQIIAIVGKEGIDFSALLNDTPVQDNAPKEEIKAAAATSPSSDNTPSETTFNNDDEGRIKASPLARKMAKEKGIALSTVQGTGDGGRIIKRDIENYTPAAASASTTPAQLAVTGQESYTDIPLSQMRKTVARRLSESKYSAPHFYLTMSITMDKAMEVRKSMNAISPTKISFNDLTIKACAMALRQHPEVNSSFMGDFIRENHHISVGTAVAVPDGLIVPVIKFADTKSLAQIAQESKELIDKARNKKLQPQEFSGNTFTISNLGMMDIDEFTAIINPPDSCILAIGKITPEPVVENGEVVIRHIMKITLSCDHRVVDGAKGAAFLQTLKPYLENPATMLV